MNTLISSILQLAEDYRWSGMVPPASDYVSGSLHAMKFASFNIKNIVLNADDDRECLITRLSGLAEDFRRFEVCSENLEYKRAYSSILTMAATDLLKVIEKFNVQV